MPVLTSPGDLRQDFGRKPQPVAPGTPATLTESTAANFNSMLATDLLISKSWNQVSVMEDMSRRYREVTGEDDLPGLNMVATINLFGGLTGGEGGRIRGPFTEEWWSKIREANQQVPEDPLLSLRPDTLNREVSKRVKNIQQRLTNVDARETSILNDIAGLGGGFAGAFVDPINIVTLPFGASASMGFLKTAVAEGVANAAVEGASQPFIQEYRNELGLPHGNDIALRNVIYAALGGAALSTAFKGVGKGIESVFDLHSGRSLADAHEKAVQEGLVDETPKTTAAKKVVRDFENVVEKNPYDPDALNQNIPKGASVHLRNMQRSMQAAKQGTVPNINVKDNPIPRKTIDLMDQGDLNNYATRQNLNVKNIEIPERMPRYGDKPDAQLRARLESSERWNDYAEPLIVLQREDGSMEAVRGLHELEVAKRSGDDIKANAFVFRQADDWTEGELRMVAASRAIHEGEATASQVADILDTRPEFFERLPKGSVARRDAPGISALSDEAKMFMRENNVAENMAARVGDRLLDEGPDTLTPRQQTEVLRVLNEENPETVSEAQTFIDEAIRFVRREDPETLFPEDKPQEFFRKRAAITNRAMKDLEKDSELFNTLIETSETLPERIPQTPQDVANVLRASIPEVEELDNALTRAANNFRKTGDLRAAADDFASKIEEAIRTGRLDGTFAERTRSGPADDRIAEQLRQRAQSKRSNQETIEVAENIGEATERLDETFRDEVQQLNEDMDPELQQALRDLTGKEDATMGDLEVPTGRTTEDPATGEITVETKTVNELMEDIDNDREFIETVRECV